MNGMRTLVGVVAGLAVAMLSALACSYSSHIWEPSSESEPPFYPVGSEADSGWIDAAGRRVEYQGQQHGDDPSNLVPSERDGLFGYSRNGVNVIEPRFLEALPFAEGKARVVLDGPPCVPVGGGMCGATPVLPRTAIPKRVKPLDWQSGRWRPTAPPCRYTFVDDSGQVIRADASFADAGNFREGLVSVRVGPLWGYADETLAVQIEPQFQRVQAFSEGLAAVVTAQGLVYIDRTGAVLIPGPFEHAGDFHEGLAVVYRNGWAWYIDKAGRHVVPGTFLHAGRFFHGRANVRFPDGGYGYIDRAGRTVYKWSSR
jgi:hypothetical protein